ncbi:hypothetical protein B0H66DRAFT_52890 [Apodospora peruviana]|uniref:Uncharacterized protein n=1 Tax=Apodospora peruviana TaxID=516989 RepID=A0AAE0MF72_9PEZI|nr:hypothetical protein B0H66DRAFT_52890 [Apodospora peruviana]
MRTTQILPILLGGLAATASPLTPTALVTRDGKVVTARAAIEAIMPTSDSCADAQFKDECRTAAQAAPFMIKAMTNFSIGQIAGMLALIALESVEMKAKHNIVPGVAGQGTSNMMSPDFVKEYATSLFGASAVDGKSPQDVLALVTPDEHNFGSAPWFLRTKCTPEVQKKLLLGTDEGWDAYMGCVGVNGRLPERFNYWKSAKTVFGLK